MNERIKRIMSKSLDIPVEAVHDELNKDSVESWDSLHHMMMIVALEREFGIEIPDNMVGNMISYRLIKSIIQHETQI